MEGTTDSTDALGNPVRLGQAYGYTQTNSGFTHVRIGIATKILPGSVSLTPTHVFLASYGNAEDRELSVDTRKVNVRSINVFPVDLATVNPPKEEE